MRSIGVTLISLALTFSVMGNAYYQKKQFYPSVVYITKSNPCMAVIYIQAFILVLLIGKLMRKIFFGQLRAAEFEHLIERSWYAVTETCLAFTVFRDDFNPKFVALFTVLLFLKSFHWLAEDRVDYMERSPIISWLFHARVLTLLSLLGALDLVSIEYAYLSTLTRGPSVQLVFGFEYAILLTMVVSVLVKYVLHTLDLNSETPSENKAVFLLYTELVIGLIKVLLYVSFVVIMVRIYTLPLFAFRPMYYTMRNFKKAFNDVILSRRAIRNMNTLYPDATPAELQAADNVCIICREEMLTASKKLPCNHIFHTACLRSWFQRQQTCPTCRLNILRPTPTANRNAPAPAAAGQQQQPQQARPAQPQPPQPPGGNILGAGVNPFQFLAGPNPFQAAGANIRPPTTSATNPSAPSTSTTPPPFLFPPFPFMPFTVPPPIPPPNLSQLTEDELRKLEGVERQNVEARIQLLRNIQLMLDTSVIMMQQYLTAAATSNTTQRNIVDANTEARNVVDQAGDVPVNADEMENSSEANSEPSTSKEASNKEETNAVVNGERNDEYNEIRRRRLQRFQNNTDAQ